MGGEMDLDRILTKLDEISRSIQILTDRITRVEVQLDGHKDVATLAKETDKRVQLLESRVTSLETKLAVWASLATAGGGGLGLALAKLFGG